MGKNNENKNIEKKKFFRKIKIFDKFKKINLFKSKNKLEKLEKMSSGEFLCYLRKKKGLSQAELGSMLSISFQSISKYEKNTNLPDVLTLRQISKIFNITEEEFYEGGYDYTKRRRQKFRLFLNFFACLFFVIVIPTLIYLSYFYYQNINSEHIYYISEDDASNNIDLKGVYYNSNNIKQIYISHISILNQDDNTNYDIKVLYEGKVINHFNNHNDLVIKLNKNIKHARDLKFKITFENQEYNFGIKKYDYFENASGFNTQKFFPYYTKLKSNEEIIKSLKNEGFQKVAGNRWQKDKKNINVQILVGETKEITLSEDTENYQKRLTYMHSSQTLDVIVYQKGNIKTNFETYKYYYEDGTFNCISGDCSSLKDSLKTMEKYRIHFSGE